MWVQTPWGVFEVKNSFFMYNTIFVYILRVPVSMKGSKGHQKSRKQRKQTGFKELAHICVLCSAIASPSLLSSSPIRVNPKIRSSQVRNHSARHFRPYTVLLVCRTSWLSVQCGHFELIAFGVDPLAFHMVLR